MGVKCKICGRQDDDGMAHAFAMIGIIIPHIKSKTTAAQQQQINAWVKIAVTAAEQIYIGTGLGADKKTYVMNFLKSKGVTLDTESLDAMIEAAVYELAHGLIEIGEAVDIADSV